MLFLYGREPPTLDAENRPRSSKRMAGAILLNSDVIV